ncbi:MAG: glycosyltransferase [Chitinophagaceae bacterium]|nr:glycosyltransferase [Chitinophagaceae bacterium]
MIPNIFHFVFGLAPDFGGKPFGLMHYIAVKSAAEINKPGKIYYHYQYEPSGEWWERAKPLLTLNKIEAPEEISGNRLYHVAHKADIVRLKMLHQHGGVYLDMDTICAKPLHNLYQHSFIMGKEFRPADQDKTFVLNNAILMAEPQSEFINIWLNSYTSFRSKGRDEYWDEHSCKISFKLAEENPRLITLLSPYHFYYPLYNEAGLKMLFEEQHDFPEAYVHHLWESYAWDKYLRDITPDKIVSNEATYSKLARMYMTLT